MSSQLEFDNEVLSDWVFAESRLSKSADAELLASHGKAQLSRALHAKKTIAVVGSGISAAYGMPSWYELLSATAEGVVEYLLDVWDARDKPANPDRRPAVLSWLKGDEDAAGKANIPDFIQAISWPSLREALTTLKELKLPFNADKLKVENLTVGFEATENLFALCRSWAKSGVMDAHVPRQIEREAHDLLREQLKWRLKDDRGRIELLFGRLSRRETWLRNLARNSGRWVINKKTSRTAKGRRTIAALANCLNHISFYLDARDGVQSHGSDLFASAFSLAFYDLGFKLTDGKETWSELLVKQLGRVGGQPIKRTIRSQLMLENRKHRDIPDLRFLVDAAITTMNVEDAASAVRQLAVAVLKNFAIPDFDSNSTAAVPDRFGFSDEAARRVADARRSARATLPKVRDPIAILAEDLRIKRFLTTNYDNQIDQYFASKGFSEPPQIKPGERADPREATIPTGSRSNLLDSLGNRAEFTAYEVGAAPFLFDFGADTRDTGHRVVHIHGRAEKRDSWLVLSERDYRERYAKDDEQSARGDDAMRLVFTANPLFFVGLGMEEPDILRPLREFTQDVGRLTDRPAIALLPMEALSGEALRTIHSAEIKKKSKGKTKATTGAAKVFAETIKVAIKKAGDDRMFDVERLHRFGVYVLRYGEEQAASGKSASSLPATLLMLGEINDIVKKREARKDGEAVAPLQHSVVKMLSSCLLADQGESDRYDNWMRKAIASLYEAVVSLQNTARVRPESFEAARLLRSGLSGAARTYFACRGLLSRVDDWQSWLAKWSAVPMRREPFGAQSMGVLLRSSTAGLSSEGLHGGVSAAGATDLCQWLEQQSHYSATRHRILLRQAPDSTAAARTFRHSLDRVRPCLNGDALTEPTAMKEQHAPSTDRFYAGSPSPAFPLLQASLQRRRAATGGNAKPLFPNPKEGRRIVFLLASRGTGRGQLFNSMQSPRRFAQLCHWLQLVKKRQTRPDWREATRDIHRGFFNLGLSHEVISVFDRVAYLLCEVVVGETTRLQGAEAGQVVREKLNAARGDRIARLRKALELLSQLSVANGKRVRRTVIIIDHMSVLFTAQGRPKNAQARRIYEALTDSAQNGTPVDFIFMVTEDHLPFNLLDRKRRRSSGEVNKQMLKSLGSRVAPPVNPRYLNPVWLRPPHLPADIEARYRQRLISAQVWNEELGKEVRELPDERVFVHLLDPVRPATLAARFFPRLAAALAAMDDWRARPTYDATRASPTMFFGTSTSDASSAAPAVHASAGENGARHAQYRADLRDDDDCKRVQKSIVETFEAIFGSIDESHWNDPFSAPKLVKFLVGDGLDIATMWFAGSEVKQIASAGTESPLRWATDASFWKMQSLDDLLGKLTQAESGAQGETYPGLGNFRTIRSAVGRNRYALTVVLAALDDMLTRRMACEPVGYVHLQPLQDFIDKLDRATTGRDPSARGDIAMDLVQDLYKTDTVGSFGSLLPAWSFEPDLAGKFGLSFENAGTANGALSRLWTGVGTPVAGGLRGVSSVLLQSLQEEILIALAKIGQPVAPEALTAVGRVSALLEQICAGFVSADDAMASHEQRIVVLCLTLDLLVHRCLLFRVAPKGSEADEHGRIEHRFATHRVLRRSIFTRFKMPLIDYSDVDFVTVSQYASQPNDLPRPEAETHRRIRLLVDQLTGYERKRNEPVHSSGDAFQELYRATPDRTERARKLQALERIRVRAAYGTMRSLYSVGVVSRFSSYEGAGYPVPEHGYFESHRLRVRWLLRKAVALDQPWVGQDCETREIGKPGIVRTFHAEEIVWLFNECGVISIAEGRYADAATLLTQARIAAREFLEGSQWGALHVRIGLNSAIAAIERGRLRDADQLLRAIVTEQREVDPLVLIAKGYRGQIDACKGDTASAYEAFEKAANALARIKRSRAAAMFMIMHADAIRLFGPANRLERADELARIGCDLATEGGHEDVRQMGQLAQTWIEITKTEGRATVEQKDRIDRRLDSVDDYARVMSMPRLQCRVALARANFMISEGDFRSAAETAQLALQSATRHDMELRKVAALKLLGTAMLRQANRNPRTSRRALYEAELLLRRARDLAYEMEYNAQVSRIEQVLADHA